MLLHREYSVFSGSMKDESLTLSRGTTDTPMVDEIERHNKRESHLQGLSIKRKGDPEEVASLIAFLLGDESQYITGSVYSIDGGWNN